MRNYCSILLVSLIACHKPLSIQFEKFYEQIPELSPLDLSKPILLEISYVEDADYPKLTDADLQRFLNRTQARAKDLLGVPVFFQLKKKIEAKDFFESEKSKFETAPFSFLSKEWHLDSDAENFSADAGKIVRQQLQKVEDKILKKYFPDTRLHREQIYQNATEQFLKRLRAIQNEHDIQGNPIYQKNIPHKKYFQSYAHWDSILYQYADADIILYNGLVAGADTEMPIYVIARGGVTSAFIENNLHRKYHGVGLVTLYPCFSRGSYFVSVRGVYSPSDSIECAAHIFVHELGHLLLHKEENYTFEGSIHRAPPDLDYMKWVNAIKLQKKMRSDEVGLLKKF